MKKHFSYLLSALMLLFAQVSLAVTVKQVSGTIDITDGVDYIISNATPFADDNSLVNIVNTDKAVVILEAVKPSEALKLLKKHVRINGAEAKNNINCQVKIYNRGCIILPYIHKNILTLYSEPNFEGTAVSSFGLEDAGGFMNTLTDAKLNNQVQSFKLKRGYMVTFSTLANGRGYSRCFIAAKKDLEIAKLPTVLNKRITSYRVFKWYDTGKQQLAAASGDNAACSALNVTSTYGWNEGTSMAPDVECVPHHIYEDWPSPATCGKSTNSPHMKTNNEPLNKSDDHPQDLKTILDNWENLMATGMRLCSPSSWDGSDYWSGTGFLKEFFDSIDARGWRCDIIDLHGYWAEGSFSKNIPNWLKAVKRPVWVSEWCWGASWGQDTASKGAFADGVKQEDVKNALQRICSTMNSLPYVERYYYWNGERDISKLYLNGKLTPAGEYYATIKTTLGYNDRYEFIPTTPRQYDPSNFKVTISNGKATIKWNDKNGEYNQLMEVQRRTRENGWTTLAVIDQQEKAASYTYEDNVTEAGFVYRIHILDVNGKHRYTAADGDVTGINTLEGSEGAIEGTKLYKLDGRQATRRQGLFLEQRKGQTRKIFTR